MATIRREKRTGSWEAIIRRTGHPTVSATFDEYAEASAWAVLEEAKILGERRNGRAVRAAHELTLGQVLDQYEREVSARKRRPELEKSLVNFWRGTELADRPMREVDAVAIQTVIDRIRDDQPPADLKTAEEIAAWRKREERRSPNRVRLYLALLSHVYTTCERRWKMGIANPVRAVERPSVLDKRRRPDMRAVRKVLAAASTPLRQYAELLLETGMRRSELARLEWSQVAWKDNVIALREGETKSGKPRDVPLSPAAVTLLRKMWRAAGRPKKGRIWTIEDAHSWSTAWRRACKRAKVDPSDCTLHGLRHERGGSLGEAGWTASRSPHSSGMNSGPLRKYIPTCIQRNS